ncbi:MAG: GNAT family N-acetyltransferase [Sumerlaeia bacterium]
MKPANNADDFSPLGEYDGLALAVHRSLSSFELADLLGHKGQPWMAHLEDFRRQGGEEAPGVRDGLAWRFYLALDDGKPVANVCTWEGGGAGLLGHVFTRASHRRRGIARALFGALLADCGGRGVRCLQLNVEPDSHQEAFYGKMGFRSVPGLAGAMVWGTVPPSCGEAHRWRVRGFEWGDWPRLNLFCLPPQAPAGFAWRGLGMDRPGSLEHPLLAKLFAPSWDVARHRIAVLDGGPLATGLPCGVASLMPGEGPGVEIFDLIVAPSVGTMAALSLAKAVLPVALDRVRWEVSPEMGLPVSAAQLGFRRPERSRRDGTGSADA